MLRAHWLLVLAFALIAGFAPVGASAAGSPAQHLAAAYSPVLAFEPQPEPCGTGETYRPTSVDILLGNPEVALRGPDGEAVNWAPTAADLFDRGEGYYLDLPGDPLSPGCTYEQDFRRWSAGKKPSVYARLANDPAHPGKLAVQYWLFYTFNDFTDRHEGDWEMVQIDFDASTPEQALRSGPYQVDVAQHAGGERADWADPKLEKQGRHPVIYVATGSHADYFGSALYLGRSATEGFGCDDTREAIALVEPRVELLPGVPSSASSPYAWLAFRGRWGQKEKGINNGPTGPATKDAWSHPIEWADGLRDASVEVPQVFGPSVTGFFCGAVTRASSALNWGLEHPLAFLVLLGIMVLGSLTAVRNTRWNPPDPRPLRRRRAGGQILRASLRLYWTDARTFIGMGAIFLPISVVAAGIQWALFHLTSVRTLVALDTRHGAVTALLALLIGSLAAAIASVATTAAVAAALNRLDSGSPVGPLEAFRLAFRRGRALAGATLRQLGLVTLLAITVIGIPFAIRRFIYWSLFAEACVLGDRSAPDSLRRSRELVRGHWWRTFGFTAVVDVVAALSGPLFGVLLLLLTDSSLNFINLAGALVYALTVPFAAIALTLYYFDLEVRDRATLVRR